MENLTDEQLSDAPLSYDAKIAELLRRLSVSQRVAEERRLALLAAERVAEEQRLIAEEHRLARLTAERTTRVYRYQFALLHGCKRDYKRLRPYYSF